MNKKINQGKDTLIPRNEWVNESEIQGTDDMVLNHPIMEKAFKNIVESFTPNHKIALVSLCTSTRPYSKSRKWKKFIEEFSDYADMIICSNGGIIPIEYEDCYPYLTYDAHGQAKYNEMYIKKIYERLMIFFNKHHYDIIVFNFRPTLRNRKSAIKFVENYKGDSKIYILPTEEAWENMLARWRSSPKSAHYFPDIEPEILNELKEVIK